jgi:hypothetical protein
MRSRDLVESECCLVGFKKAIALLIFFIISKAIACGKDDEDRNNKCFLCFQGLRTCLVRCVILIGYLCPLVSCRYAKMV